MKYLSQSSHDPESMRHKPLTTIKKPSYTRHNKRNLPQKFLKIIHLTIYV
jgi:hypothetical protein